MTVLHAPDLFDPAVVDDPYPLFERLRREAAVWQVPGTELYLVSTWDLVTEAVARPEDFSSNLTALLGRDGAGQPVLYDMTANGTAIDVLATADEPQHAVHRRLVVPHLVARRVEGLRAEVTRLVDALWTEGLTAGGFEWASAMADRLPLAVIARLIGLPDADIPRLLRPAYEGTELLAGVGGERMAELSEAAAALAAYLGDRYADARRRPGGGVLGDLVQASRAGELTDHKVVATLVQLVGAGGESTAGLIGNRVRLLAARPEVQARLRADPTLVPRFLEEALRLESPFRGHYRLVRRATRLGGVALPEGAHLMLLWGSANRDPDVFDRPDEIVLDRPSGRSHLAFGRGLHFCVGAALARVEAAASVNALLERTQSFAVDPDVAPAWAPSIFVRRQARLRLHVQPATPLRQERKRP